MRESKKIVITGLSEVGKTWIINKIAGTSIEELEKKGFLPTKDYETKKFSLGPFQITGWDLAGQKKYRQTFFKRGTLMKKVFGGVDVCVYVADISTDSHEELLTDLENVINALSISNGFCHLVIFLHKHDLINKGTLNAQAPIQLTNKIMEKISSIPPNVCINSLVKGEEEKINLYPTSVYDESLNFAMSKVVNKIFHKKEAIDDILSNFYEDLKPKGINECVIQVLYNSEILSIFHRGIENKFIDLGDGSKESKLDYYMNELLLMDGFMMAWANRMNHFDFELFFSKTNKGLYLLIRPRQIREERLVVSLLTDVKMPDSDFLYKMQGLVHVLDLITKLYFPKALL